MSLLSSLRFGLLELCVWGLWEWVLCAFGAVVALGMTSRLALAELGVKFVGFCDEFPCVIIFSLGLQFGVSEFELLSSVVRWCPFLLDFSFEKKVGQLDSTCSSSGFRLLGFVSAFLSCG